MGGALTFTGSIEVLNLLLGEGNDRLTITGTRTVTAAHGGITTVHGGGNALLEVRGNFTVAGQTLTRTDGVSWASAGFAVGHLLTVDGAVVGTITALSGATLTVAGGLPAVQSGATVAVRDPKTGTTRIGGDTIVVTGGGGPDSPLVVYGDTSQDGRWYAGEPARAVDRRLRAQAVPEPDRQRLPAVLLPAGHAVPLRRPRRDRRERAVRRARSRRAVGITAYGGAGDDLIIGSQTGDHLAGGSGDDTILGQRGADLIYGDSGVNVDVITRALTVPTRQRAPPRATADLMLAAGNDVLLGRRARAPSARPSFDDVIFGDHGRRRRSSVGGPEPAEPAAAGASRRPASSATSRPSAPRTVGGNDVIHGNARPRPDLRRQRRRHDHRRRRAERRSSATTATCSTSPARPTSRPCTWPRASTSPTAGSTDHRQRRRRLHLRRRARRHDRRRRRPERRLRRPRPHHRRREQRLQPADRPGRPGATTTTRSRCSRSSRRSCPAGEQRRRRRHPHRRRPRR